MAPLSFGLNLPRNASSSKASPAKGFARGDESDGDDDGPRAVTIGSFDEEEQSQVLSRSQAQKPAPPSKLKRIPAGLDAPTGASLSSKLRHDAIQSAAKTDDPSVFDYDAHFGTTSSAAADARKRTAARAEAETRTPKYVQNMASAAAIREKDQLRAKDKVLQQERAAEGDEFAGKEQFVTAAYKEQQAAARRAEDEEAKREEAEAKSGKAMQNFWRGMMKEDDQRYEKEAVNSSGVSQPIDTDPQQNAEQEATERAKVLNAKGANIEINADGQVADKRQLLAAGLNVVSKAIPAASSPGDDAHSLKMPSSSRSAEHRASKEAMRKRQSRMLADQLGAAQKRRAEEEAEELSKRERAAKSQKTKEEVSSARERFLARKKEAAAAMARGDAP